MKLRKFESRVGTMLPAERRSSLVGSGYAPAAPVLSGTFVTPETAIGLAPVYAAINCISRDLAGLPRHCYQQLAGGGRAIDRRKRVDSLISSTPDGERDAFAFFQATTSHVLGWGNGYSEIVRDGWTGEPTALRIQHPSKTKPYRTESGRLMYELADGRKLVAEDVLHFAGLGFDGIKGYSPIMVARQTVGLSLAVEQFGAAYFGNGSIPRGIIKLKEALSEEAQANLREQMNIRHQSAANAHSLLFLEEGADFIPTKIDPNDGQWIETRGFQVKEVARIYGLPPHKLGDYSESHISSVEEGNEEYLAQTLMGWVNTFESQMNFKLLTSADRETHAIAFDLSALLRANTLARMSKWQILRNAGAVNTDEIRLGEGMNPIGAAKGGELYLVQGQYRPLDQVGKSLDPTLSKRSTRKRTLQTAEQ